MGSAETDDKYISRCDAEKDKQEGCLMDELIGIKIQEECLHEPNQLDHLGCEVSDVEIVHVYKCECGKEIREEFSLSKRMEI
ncbi:MAG: hypothetical protein HF978_06475 [Desulfobacteraceae bacterium]|nr:hypothetical protein [Desulfobacteraceae bacterium]MBC2755176.1 hypothetical protein [Desulfobacteraceae bacterium]